MGDRDCNGANDDFDDASIVVVAKAIIEATNAIVAIEALLFFSNVVTTCSLRAEKNNTSAPRPVLTILIAAIVLDVIKPMILTARKMHYMRFRDSIYRILFIFLLSMKSKYFSYF